MAKTVENFARDVAPADTAGRLDAPAFHRNCEAILDVFSRHLGASSGAVLEIGSGTGQHCAALADALPNLTFWPTDPVAEHVSSIDAWAAETRSGNMQPATQLDCLEAPWQLGGESIADRSLKGLISINVIHIAPWEVAEAIIAGAGRHLQPAGLLMLYGPYKKNGRHTSESNAQFDLALRTRNPAFGVRDLEDITECAGRAGLKIIDEVAMPANNLTLVFARS
ncbi:MAG: DUF938 domain-containing protein [Alphaproteobacteria bacterium]|nr:DUF938 domain-containing protein [Alphaproteobacteria bacterium]